MKTTDLEKHDTGIKKELLQEIIAIAIRNDIDCLILFGSRARGDHRGRSDIDLAFRGGSASRFIADVNEDTNTLLSFDMIDLDQPISTELLSSIQKEGIVIYEKI